MSARSRALAPFRVRSFRYQWPADLATSWAFEMETLILGWYVLTETKSLFLLTVFASLQYVGTLLAPMFGVMGDRLGHRNVLCGMRVVYALCAVTLMTFVHLGALTPIVVMAVAAVMGLVRPSDIGTRAAVVGAAMPPEHLMSAMSIQRTTQDMSRIAGALSGASLVAFLGIGPAYAAVAAFYTLSVVLTLKAGGVAVRRPAAPVTRVSPWRDLREGLAYVWNTPYLLAIMTLAFLLNLTAFPLLNGLQPYVAKEIYLTDQRGLGYMVAAGAFGALAGSIALTRMGAVFRPARLVVAASVSWYVALLIYSHAPYFAAGLAVLVFAGFAQSISMVPMATLLLRHSDHQYRGRIMGIRMLAIYGNIPGLLLAGPLIANFGYPTTATIYCAVGIAVTAWIAVRWREQLWRADAPENRR